MASKAQSRSERREEFESYLKETYQSAFRVALGMTRNEADAEDLVQETFTRAYTYFSQFKKGTNFKAWLFKILTNTYINRYRKKTREGETVSLDTVDTAYDSMLDSDQFINRFELPTSLVDSDFGDEVKKALSELPDEYRSAVLLADVEGLTYDEIALALDCPKGTVRSRISRGRKQLQVKLFRFAQQRKLA